ncbi:hypothetical protein [Halomonas sp. I5-271120]|uniref:hypothetical protein n=1 Tax=Halomonas sp. I5-271120 TaxID=3061632 RepID=UPI002714CCE3|nr:hypothetical protein [Halomonas sp. I5-271120]
MQVAAQQLPHRMPAAWSVTSRLDLAVEHLAMELRVPAQVLKKLMLDALRYPVVHCDLTHHTHLEVMVEDSLRGQLLPIPPILLSFLEEGIGQGEDGYEIPLSIDGHQHAEYLTMLARAQWVLRRGSAQIQVPLFRYCRPNPEQALLALTNDFPVSELVHTGRDHPHIQRYHNFVQHHGSRNGMSVTIPDTASRPTSNFGSTYSMQRALVAHRRFIYESLRLDFEPVLVPRLCAQGLPMRYQVRHQQSIPPLGCELRTLEGLQEKAMAEGGCDLWIDDSTSTANIYGGHQGLLAHWRGLELLVQREGCLPVHQRFLTVLQEDHFSGRAQVRLELPLIAPDEFLDEDELL